MDRIGTYARNVRVRVAGSRKRRNRYVGPAAPGSLCRCLRPVICILHARDRLGMRASPLSTHPASTAAISWLALVSSSYSGRRAYDRFGGNCAAQYRSEHRLDAEPGAKDRTGASHAIERIPHKAGDLAGAARSALLL